jgi:hypothetical protein
VIFYLVNFCKILISKITKGNILSPISLLLFGKEKSSNFNTGFFTWFLVLREIFASFFTKMEPI